MTAVLMRARSELRARLTSTLALILLVGIGAAAVMALGAGARRTDTAYPRFARAYKAANMVVYPSFNTQFAQLDYGKVAKLPQVEGSMVQHITYALNNFNVGFSANDPSNGTEVDRYKLLEGHQPINANDVLLPLWVANVNHWRVGTTHTIVFATSDQPPKPIPTTVRVAGIEASPGEFPPQINNNSPGSGALIHITPALYGELTKKNLF
ncbi:MAG TPA: hypothetical protein VJ818_06700, partial [Actinomycetota bacterium]|nr:hypothetical protein [Actinomycetota bacterium]